MLLYSTVTRYSVRTGEPKRKVDHSIKDRCGYKKNKSKHWQVPYNDTSESIGRIGMDGQSSNNEIDIGSNTSDFMRAQRILISLPHQT